MYDHYCNNKLCKLSIELHSEDYTKCSNCVQYYQPDNIINQNYRPSKHYLNQEPDLNNVHFNDYYDPNFDMTTKSNKSFSLSSHESSNKKKKQTKERNGKELLPYIGQKKEQINNLKNLKDLNKIYKNDYKLPINKPQQLSPTNLTGCYTCEKSKFKTIQTYESIKYILMTVILVSIIDGLFTLNYQKLFIQNLQIILLKQKNPLMFCEYNKLFLFNDDKLRIATGMLYLINVSIQFIGFVGISNDSLILSFAYSFYSIICFIFTIGTYLNYRRLFISLCINCLLAILSIIFSIMIKIVKPIKKKNSTILI